MSQKLQGFEERYYWIIITLSLCRPVLLSGYFQSEHVAEGEIYKTTILSEPKQLKPI